MKNLYFCIFLAILLLSLFAVYSCGTRKTDLSRSETKSGNINIENQYTSGTKIVLGSSFTYTPFDGLKKMVIDGKEYKNAIVKGSNSRSLEKYFNVKETKYIRTSYNIEKTKTVYRNDNTVLWLGMFAIVVIAIIAYLAFKKWGIV